MTKHTSKGNASNFIIFPFYLILFSNQAISRQLQYNPLDLIIITTACELRGWIY